MIKNYFKTAWRNLVHNKTFSLINILGLGLGMACSLLIFLWVQDERNVDGFHANGKQLYQVFERQYYDGKIEASHSTQGLLADELKRTIPGIEHASGFEFNTNNTFEAGDKIDKMEGSFAGTDFFTMFSYPLLEGTPSSALNTVNDIAISRRMAEHFFGSAANAIGKTILYENRDNLLVTAVFEDIPVNSSQKFDFLRSWTAFIKENEDWVHNWGNTDGLTFVQLRKDADPAKVQAAIKDFVYRYQEKSKAFVVELDLQSYIGRYLHSVYKNGRVAGGRIEYVRLFSIVAIFILLIACINFMNLATARSMRRAKEVGVRKVVGAARFALMVQFMGEALLLTLFSIIIAVIIVMLLLPAFNSLIGKQLTIPFGKPVFWMALTGLLLLTGFVAGSYPALFLSSLKPIRVLKGRLRFNVGTVLFRKGLVILQFSLSILFVIGMIVTYRQLKYIQTKNIGYDRENLVYVPLEGDLRHKYGLFKEEALKMPGILQVSKIRQSPTGIASHTGDIQWPGKDPNVVISFANTVVGYDFVKTMNLQLGQGRDFSKNFGTDTSGYIINEAALQRIGYKDPIGKPLTWGHHPGTIIGVLRDFHFASMHQAIDPLIIRLEEDRPWATMLIRTQAGKTKEAIAGLEKISKVLNPKFPFTYQFSDQEFDKLYRSEGVVSKLSNYFAFLAIFISCLGLFGLATFTAEQRTKEIGIRKAIGASTPGIYRLLLTNLLKPVVIAMLISFPVAWYTMNRWLEDFVYRVNIGWQVFILAGSSAILIALMTVSFQAIKAAITNPVKSLRTE